MLKTNHWLLTTSLALGLSACGGGGGGSSSDPVVETGIFVDSRVAGVNYRTETRSGVTTAQGEYNYVAGETVTFSIGSIILGSAAATGIVTPMSLVPGATDANNPFVTNIVKLLVSLDSDNNPDNGISINQTTMDAANSVTLNFNQPVNNFEADADVTAFMSALGETLVTTTVAQNHFQGSLKSTWDLSQWDSPTSNNSAWK